MFPLISWAFQSKTGCLEFVWTMNLWASAWQNLQNGIRPVWSESLLGTQWVAKDPSFLHADSEDSDQTGRIPWLIRVFAGSTLFVGFVMCWFPSVWIWPLTYPVNVEMKSGGLIRAFTVVRYSQIPIFVCPDHLLLYSTSCYARNRTFGHVGHSLLSADSRKIIVSF